MPIFLFNGKCPRRFLIPYEKHLRAIKNMRPNWESQRNCIATKYEQEVAKEHPLLLLAIEEWNLENTNL